MRDIHMANQTPKGVPSDVQAVHDYYAGMMRFIPHLVYWIDEQGLLKGCNQNFKQVCRLKDRDIGVIQPYKKMGSAFHLDAKKIKLLQEEDMRVIHADQGKHNRVLSVKTPKKNQPTQDYLCNRDPLHDQTGRVTGAIIVMMEALKQQATAQPIAEIQPAVLLSHPPVVLIVEDNTIARKAAESLFKSLECQVDSAQSYQHAAALFQPGKYDLVVMDIELEDASGYFIAKEFRITEKNTQHHVPIIALTSHDADRIKFYCDDYYMEGALNKPLHAGQAEQILERYVYKKDTLVGGLKHA